MGLNVNGIERAQQVLQNAPLHNERYAVNAPMKPPMSGKPSRREKLNGGSGLKSHRPPTGRQQAGQPPSESQLSHHAIVDHGQGLVPMNGL